MTCFAHRSRQWVLPLVMCALLAACAEEESGPQFANERAATRAATSTPLPATPGLIPATPMVATPASVADTLATRGAPSRVFAATSSGVWAVSTSGESHLIYATTPEERLIAVDAAPGGAQAALVLAVATANGERTDVAIIDANGKVTTRVDGLAPKLATPEPEKVRSSAVAIDWSPQADRALVSFGDGAIVELPIGSDELRTLLGPMGDDKSIIHPTWSPTGEAVAFIATGADGRTRALQVLDVSDGSVRDIVTPADGRFVVDYAWMPNGISLLFTEGGELGGAVTGIDLWRVDADGENRSLVVSAGTVAPVARITNVQPSPDGRSVAYSVLVPGGAEPQVESVWVRDLSSRLGFRIQLPSVNAVNALAWTDRGLAIEVVTGENGSGAPPAPALLHVNRDGSVALLWAAPTAVGTPVSGTPVASPATR